MKKLLALTCVMGLSVPVQTDASSINANMLPFFTRTEQVQDEFLNVTYQYGIVLKSLPFDTLNGARILDRVEVFVKGEADWEIKIDGVEDIIGTDTENSFGGTTVSAGASIYGPGLTDEDEFVPYTGNLPLLVQAGKIAETQAVRVEPNGGMISFEGKGSSLQTEKFINNNGKEINYIFIGQVSLGVIPNNRSRPFATADFIDPKFDQSFRRIGSFATYFFHSIGQVEHPEDFSVRFTTGSPTSITQAVDVPSDSFDLTFEYQFETTSGELSVLLGDTEIGSLAAPASLEPGVFHTASFPIDIFLGETDVDLSFILDGPDGSSILLDDIMFPSILNGGFQFGDVSEWVTDFSGEGSVEAVAFVEFGNPVPTPTSAMSGAVLFGLAALRYRRASV